MTSCRKGAWLAILLALAACTRPAPRFSVQNARAHVSMLAGTIGSRPVGTPEDARARQYIVDQLQLYGFTVRVQEVDARRPEFGLTAHVFNIIAERPGTAAGSIGLVSHYDSAPESPGGGDDGSGVAICLEAARVLAASANRHHGLIVLVTDGEEAGLMGAAGAASDRDLMQRLQAYVNVEAIGSSGTALLFESGPGNAWIVGPWAHAAPHPRGTSYATEVYRVLPNDTDFTILKRHDIPGLNFAIVDDSYAYHTARDTADRVTDDALRTSGENVVATVEALDARDLTTRTQQTATYFSIGGVGAMTWGPVAAWILAIVALVCGVLAWFKALAASVRLLGIGRWVLDAVWTLLGCAVVAGAMVLATWLLRESRTVYHPWYAHPGRLVALLLTAGLLAGWSIARIGRWLPARAHGLRDPIIAWSIALPLWIVLAGVAATVAPAAGYLWTLPLLVAGIGLLVAPVRFPHATRIVSVIVLAVAGTLWLRETTDLLWFAVCAFGRLPIITPVYAYAALMLICGAMLVPPFVATVAATSPVGGPSVVTAALLVAVVVSGGLAYKGQAYTNDRPQRRIARVLVGPSATDATFEVASQEPGLDLAEDAPRGWQRVGDAPATLIPARPLRDPFVFRTTAPAPGPAPASITSFEIQPVAAGSEVSMTVTPTSPGLTVWFVAPPGVQPARSNLPGVLVAGRWIAGYTAIPPGGVTWRASFAHGRDSDLAKAFAVVTSHRYPGGSGWQSLPSWLPQEHAVWSLQVQWALQPPIAPVPPLR